MALKPPAALLLLLAGRSFPVCAVSVWQRLFFTSSDSSQVQKRPRILGKTSAAQPLTVVWGPDQRFLRRFDGERVEMTLRDWEYMPFLPNQCRGVVSAHRRHSAPECIPWAPMCAICKLAVCNYIEGLQWAQKLAQKIGRK